MTLRLHRLFPLLALLLLLPQLAQGQVVLSDRSANGSLTASWNGTGTAPANSVVLVSLPSQGSAAVQVTGTFSATLSFEALIDQKNATWLAIKGTPFAGGTTVSAASATGAWVFPLGGVKVFRVRCSAYTSGTALVGVVASNSINTGTIASGSGGSGTATSVSAADEAAFTPGTDPFNPIGGLFNDSAAALTSGQIGVGRSTPSRAQHVNLRNNAGTEIGTSSNPVRVDPTGTTPQPVTGTFFQATQPVSGTVTATPTGTQDIQGAQAAAAAITEKPVLIAGQNAGNVKLFGLDASGFMTVTQGTAGNGGTAGWFIQGQNASGAAISGNPVTIGSGAVAFGTAPSTVTAGQVTPVLVTRSGLPFVIGGHPNVITVRANFTTAQTDTALVTVAAGTKIVVTSEMVTASNADTVNPSVVIGFGTANTPTTTGVIGAHPGIAPGSGFGKGNGAGIVGIGADDEDLRITSGVPTGGSLDVVISYFTTPS